MNPLLTTIIQRPYVFLFLAAFLWLAWRRWGGKKTILWLISGYLIAWASEYSSIHNGFPYGHYKYVYENMPGELMIAGVPFFDSLSYPFLAFAGFMTAKFLTARRRLLFTVLLGAFLTMMLDVIIDPVATMGEKWFLGQIHYYVNPGWYFGVPLTNFGGWFLVALAICGFNAIAWHAFPNFFKEKKKHGTHGLLEPLFYISIALFQIVMAFWIGEVRLGMVNVMIIAVLGVLLVLRKGDVSTKTEDRI
jgi:putative membrane protein